MKSLVTVVASLVVFAVSALASDVLVGRYAPPALDAGIALTLRQDGTFAADWWAQRQKDGEILRGSIVGSWSHSGSELVLRYVTKERQSAARFEVLERTVPVLKLTHPGEFPFVAFFGEEYAKEETPNQPLQPTTMSVTDRADARSAPATVVADL